MSFFPRFPAGEFAPLFRLLDDYASHQLTRTSFPAVSSVRTFQPRFDVREVKDGYELHGELPGINQQDISIEFTDAQTLSIKGRSERHTERGTPDNALEGTEQQSHIADTASETSSTSNYHKASVEDESTQSGAAPSGEESPAQDNQVSASEQQTVQQHQQQPQQPQHRYWVSERSVGEFSRTFNFPDRVDQDNVKASLKNGILSIIVPKAAAPVSKRITID